MQNSTSPNSNSGKDKHPPELRPLPVSVLPSPQFLRRTRKRLRLLGSSTARPKAA